MEEKLYDVFISYSSKDQKLVEAMCHYLEERNLRCFVAYRDVPKGKDWGPFIEKGIEDSKVLVYVHTEASNMSEETTREINLAFEEGCVVIPFRVSAIKYGTGKRYRLNNLNWLDAFPQSPENYFGDLFDILKVNFPQRIQQKEDQKARLEAEKAEAERIKRKKEEAERRERERRQREEEARRRREERERRKEELKEWWKRNKSKCVMLLAVIAGAVAGTWCIKNCEGITETATVTDTEPIVNINDTTELLAVVPTNSEMLDSKPANESVASEAEAQRQAELEKQKAQQKKKRQAEEKKKQDEAKFNEYKKKGDDYYLLLVGSPDNKSYKDQAKYYYGLALQYKEDAKVRNRFENLKK